MMKKKNQKDFSDDAGMAAGGAAPGGTPGDGDVSSGKGRNKIRYITFNFTQLFCVS